MPRQHYLTHVGVCYSPSELKESQQLKRLKHWTTKKKVMTSLFHDCAQIITPLITTLNHSCRYLSISSGHTHIIIFNFIFHLGRINLCKSWTFIHFFLIFVFCPSFSLQNFGFWVSLSWRCIICQILMGTADSCGLQLGLWLFQPQLSYL